MKKIMLHNSVYEFEGVGFDPIANRNTISISQIWITNYSKRKGIKYGFKKRTAIIMVDSTIEAFKGKTSEEIDVYINEHWKDFLIYAVNNFYPDLLSITYGTSFIDKPRWETIEEAKETLEIENEEIQAVTPYS